MGLDMYLSAEKYISGWQHESPENQRTYAELVNLLGLHHVTAKDSPSGTVSLTVAYWRKANAIHGWFVKHVQDDVDKCFRYDVQKDQLQDLFDVAVEAKSKFESGDRKAAAALLPPMSGFFFGSTELDENYLDDLNITIDQLKPLLELDHLSFSYQSSW